MKKLSAIIFTAILIFAFSIRSYADEIEEIDLSHTGTITINMRDDDKAVPGGDMTLYAVGTIQKNNGDYVFTLGGSFVNSGVSLEDIQSAEVAKKLAKYAEDNKLSGILKTIDNAGNISFTVKPGLYLLVQNKAANGYMRIKPFLVSLPIWQDGGYLYDVNASPKVLLEKEDPEPSSPEKPKPDEATDPIPPSPGKPKPPVSPGKPKPPVQAGDTSLPKTGQLNWPVSALSIAGLLLFSLGWALRVNRRKPEIGT